MPLDEYRRKRDFRRTPEPEGSRPGRRRRGGAGGGGYFCVQKHLASQLHYDLRLEHGGVLLSWAVPKGPSLQPSDRRMAVRTEDHPYEYGGFEGVIPEGYGAGIVMPWDRGAWTPEVDDVDAALEKGDLKFALDGYKLKGSWALVRTRDRERTPPGRHGRNWLLLKHADFWSGPVDVTEFAPLSVESEGDFDDILAADMPDLWLTGRPATAAGRGRAAALTREVIERAARKILERREAAGLPPTEAGAAPARSRRRRPGAGARGGRSGAGRSGR